MRAPARARRRGGPRREQHAAKRAFLDAAACARRQGMSRELARAAAGYGGRIVWVRAGTDDRLVPLLEEGLAALARGRSRAPGPALWPASRARFATSARAIAATR